MENNSQPYYIIFIIKTLHFHKGRTIHVPINDQHFQSIHSAMHLCTGGASQPACGPWHLLFVLPTEGDGRPGARVFAQVYTYLAKLGTNLRGLIGKKLFSLKIFVLPK